LTLVTSEIADTGTGRPATVKATIILLFFLGVTALGGGTAMVLGLGDENTMLPNEWLADIPLIDSWVVPGLVLGAGFGLGALVVGYGMTRRPRWTWLGRIEGATGRHWAWLATLVLGAGHLLWIALQLVFLPGASWLHLLYGAIGLSLVALPLTPSMRTELLV
jgi:hypothetical protein